MNDDKEKSLVLKKESKPSEEKVSEPNLSSVVENENPPINQNLLYEYQNNSKIDTMIKKFSKVSFDLRKEMLNKHHKMLLIVDSVCCIINIVVVTALYFEHFEYLTNIFILSKTNNIVRFICLFLSFITCLLIIFRYYNKCEYENLKYLQKLRAHAYMKSIDIKYLSLEILFNLIQPYPYLKYEFAIKIMGNEVNYTLNMLLFIIAVSRLYVVIKFLKFWLPYSSDESKRIFKFYKNKNFLKYLYKVTLKAFTLICMAFIFCAFIYIFALYFKILEHYDPNSHSGFYYIWNCLWYLVVTMATIGYGDFTPSTLMGRLIGVFCCLVGILLMSIIVVALVINTHLENEEYTAFEQIDKNYEKEKDENEYADYYKTFLKYKAMKLNHKKHDISELLIMKHKLDIKRECIAYKIRSINSQTYNMNTFNKDCENLLDKFDLDLSDKLFDNIIEVITKTENIVKKKESNFNKVKICKKINFQMLNFVKFISHVGFIICIESINEIYGKTVLGHSTFDLKIREFYFKHKISSNLGTKLPINNNNLNRSNNTASNFFLNDNSSVVEEEKNETDNDNDVNPGLENDS